MVSNFADPPHKKARRPFLYTAPMFVATRDSDGNLLALHVFRLHRPYRDGAFDNDHRHIVRVCVHPASYPGTNFVSVP